MPQRLLSPTPSLPNRFARRLLQRIGLHPVDREAKKLDLSGTSALCIATNHAVLDLGVATGVFASELGSRVRSSRSPTCSESA